MLFGHGKLFGIWCLFIGILMSGCATVKECARGIAGISTRELEEERINALKKTFNCDLNTCYNTVEDTLKRIKAYVYTKDKAKNMLAIYVSEEDTTPVGIFFSSPDPLNTQVEISSPSSYAKELIANKIFSDLNKFNKIPEKQEAGDVPEPVQNQ
jgi:hypothetical protein